MSSFIRRAKHAWEILTGKAPVTEAMTPRLRLPGLDSIKTTREVKVSIGDAPVYLAEGEYPRRVLSVTTNATTSVRHNAQAQWRREVSGKVKERVLQFTFKGPDEQEIVFHGLFQENVRALSVFSNIDIDGYMTIEIELGKPAVLRQ